MHETLSTSSVYAAIASTGSCSPRLITENSSSYHPQSGKVSERPEHARKNQSGKRCVRARTAVNEAAKEEQEVATELVQRIRAGDKDAETELIVRYSRGVLFLLQHRSGDEQLAHDLHQETFCVVLIRLRDKGLTDPAKLVGFIHRTAVNLFIGDYRKMRRRKTNPDIDRVVREADPKQQGLARVLQTERAALVRRLISELKQQRDRELLERFYLKEESKQKLCIEMELDHLHFDRVLFRARQRLKQLALSHVSELKAP